MTSALRILIVSDVSPFYLEGGAERVLEEEASRLVTRGHQVHIVCRSPARDAAERIERQGVWVRHFPVDRRSLLQFIRSSILEARHAATRELAAVGADVLHLHQPLSGYGVLRSPAGARIPSLYTFHSPAPLEYRSRRGMTGHHRGGWAGSLGMALLWIIEGACLRRATRIHVLSNFSAAQLWKLYRIPANRIVKIPGGVDTERFRPATDRGAVRCALGLSTRSPLLLTVRNLEARMGLDTLIQAMEILRRDIPEVVLLIGGAGSLRGELESLTVSLNVQDNIRFLGFVPEAQLPFYYQAADVFVLPTRALEGFGLVTVEALACGTPVLGTPVGATPEILLPLDPSLVFHDTTPAAMAEDLWRFLNTTGSDPTSSQRLRQACRCHAETYYSWDQSVASLVDTLDRLAEHREDSPEHTVPCQVCGASTMEASVVYQGRPYRRCSQCRTSVVATLPTTTYLRRYYEIEYPWRFRHERTPEPRAEMFVSLLEQLRAFRASGHLLDVGCGGGHLLAAAGQQSWHGSGTDLSHQACTVVRQAYGLPVIQADSAEMPLRDACVDAVTLVNVLDHTLDPLATLREAHRVLTPGGYLAIRIPNAAFHRPWARLLAAVGPLGRWYGWDGYPVLHLFAFTAGGLRYLVERAGFHILVVRNSALAAVGPWQSPASPTGMAWRWVHRLIATAAVSVAILSRGRWLVGPSIELYACKRSPAEVDLSSRHCRL